MSAAVNRRARETGAADDVQSASEAFSWGTTPASAPMPGYARFIGRVGALAVALGVGVAVVTGHGVPLAQADETTENAPADQHDDDQPAVHPSSGGNDTPAGVEVHTPTVVVNGTPVSGGSGSGAGTTGGTAVPQMNFDAQGVDHPDAAKDEQPPVGGGSTTIEGATQPTPSPTPPLPPTGSTPPIAPVVPVPPADPTPPAPPTAPVDPAPPNAAANPAPPVTPKSNGDRSAVLTTIVDGSDDITTPTDRGADSRVTTLSANANTGSTTDVSAQRSSTLVAPQPNVIEPEQPNLLAGIFSIPGIAVRLAVTVATGFLAPFAIGGPTGPLQPPVVWAVLAWVRREFQRTLFNHPPSAVDDTSIATDEGHAVTITALANDVDVDEDPFAVSDYTQPDHGTVALNPDGTFTYTPDPGYHGTDTFQYALSDTSGLPHWHGILRGLFNVGHQDVATVSVTVNAVDDNVAPVADDDTATVAEGGAVDVDVLNGDTDANGNTTIAKGTVIVTRGPDHGAASVDPVTGVVTYTHDGSETLTDSFAYTVEDVDGAVSNAATVTITVTPVNDPSVANGDTATTTEDTAVDITVLANDTDPDGPIPATYVSVTTGPSHGTATVNADGTIKYTPTTNSNGPDSFTYTLDDGDPATVNPTATVNISVTPVNDTPALATSTSTDTTTGKVTITVVVTDPDAGDTRTITLSPPAGATGTVGPVSGPTYDPVAQTYTYTAVYTPSPQARVNAFNTSADPDVDSVTVTVSDGVATDVTKVVDVTISPLAAANGGTITTGGYPAGIVISPDGKRAYVANLVGNSVSVIDTDPNSPTFIQRIDTSTAPGVNDIAVGNSPIDVALSADGKRLYVTNAGSNSVSVIDVDPSSANRYKVIDTDGVAANGVTNISVGNSPKEITLSPDGTRAYVANALSNSVSVIDVDPTSVNYNKVIDADPTTSAIDTIPVGNGPYAVGVSPDGKRLFVTNITSTSVTVVDVEPGSPTRYQVIDANGAAAGTAITLAAGANPNGVAFSPDGTTAYVTNTNLGSVTVIDIAPGSPTRYQIVDVNPTATGVQNIPVGSAPVGIEINAAGTRAYVVNSISNTMTVIDIAPGSPTRYQVVDTNPTTAGVDSVGGVANPLALALTPDGTRAYVSNTSAGTVTVIYLANDQPNGDVTAVAVDNGVSV